MSLEAGNIVKHVYATYVDINKPLIGIVNPIDGGIFSVRTNHFLEPLEHAIFKYYSQED